MYHNGGRMAQQFDITIDNKVVNVESSMSILVAAKKLGIHIPALCYHPDLHPTASCGICVVDVEGRPQPLRACCTPVSPGMVVFTNTLKLREYRKAILKLLLSDHDVVCPTCPANEKCELQRLASNMDIQTNDLNMVLDKKPLDETSDILRRDNNKCVSCGRCITVCSEVQSVNALSFVRRGFKGSVETAFEKGIGESPCVYCGQCTVYCPTGALFEKSDIENVWNEIFNKEKHVVIQEAPAIRVSLADEFGMKAGELTTEKMYAALRAIGFDTIMDTNFAADLTIMEEATELVEKLKAGSTKPLITSCSPGWVKFMETFYPDLLDCLSSAKSPMSMFGVMAKTYYAKEKNIDPKNIVSVAIMPCISKKFEAARPELNDSGYRDTDYVLTTREFIKMIKEVGIDFNTIEPISADAGMSAYSGAGTIFGTTGGVMEAALRTGYYLITGKELENVEITAVRGLKGVKETEVDVPGFGKLKVAVANGLSNARKLMDKIRKQLKETGKCDYHFIEVMACPGGCVGGGGQPKGNDLGKRVVRGAGLYEDDKKCKLRRSHENPEVKKMYDSYLGKPNGELAHKLLHTKHYKRSQFDGKPV